jgi:hypothetical protein
VWSVYFEGHRAKPLPGLNRRAPKGAAYPDPPPPGRSPPVTVTVKVCMQDDMRSTQDTGPTKVVVCESVEVALVQPTRKIFSSKEGRWILWSSKLSNALRTAHLKIKVRVHQRSRTRETEAYVRGARMNDVVYFDDTGMCGRIILSPGA